MHGYVGGGGGGCGVRSRCWGLGIVPGVVGCQEQGLESAYVEHAELANDQHPEVGIIWTDSGHCTATLIGTQTIVTAAHCVGFTSGEISGRFDLYQLQSNELTTRPAIAEARDIVYSWSLSSSIAEAVATSFATGDFTDIAVVKLVSPILTVEPAQLNYGSVGPKLELVGYGDSGDGCSVRFDGSKRRALEDTGHSWDIGGLGCSGDSGAPYFDPGTNKIVAVFKGTLDLGDLDLLRNYSTVEPNLSWFIDRMDESEGEFAQAGSSNVCTAHPQWRTWNCADAAGHSGSASYLSFHHVVSCRDPNHRMIRCPDGCRRGGDGADDACVDGVIDDNVCARMRVDGSVCGTEGGLGAIHGVTDGEYLFECVGGTVLSRTRSDSCM